MKHAPGGSPDAADQPVLDDFANWLAGKDLAARTIALYLRHVTSLAGFAASTGKRLLDLTQEDIEAFVVANKAYAPRTQASLRYPIQNFYKFASEHYGLAEDPALGVSFTKQPPLQRRQRRQVGQRLAKLSTRDRQIALFVSELREAGATVNDIFDISERVPVPTQIQVRGGRAGSRTLTLSDQARALLDEWGGRLPIKVRAFQRVVQKVGLSPKDLGDPAHPGLADLHGTLLPEGTLHRTLERKTRPAFLRGEYDTAILVAMKSVEVAVRSAGGFSDEDIGVPLMREAFHITKGPLRDRELVRAEREATSNLFAGAIGLFKNPTSHRDIDLADPFEVAGVIRLADVLLRIVDRARSV